MRRRAPGEEEGLERLRQESCCRCGAGIGSRGRIRQPAGCVHSARRSAASSCTSISPIASSIPVANTGAGTAPHCTGRSPTQSRPAASPAPQPGGPSRHATRVISPESSRCTRSTSCRRCPQAVCADAATRAAAGCFSTPPATTAADDAAPATAATATAPDATTHATEPPPVKTLHPWPARKRTDRMTIGREDRPGRLASRRQTRLDHLAATGCRTQIRRSRSGSAAASLAARPASNPHQRSTPFARQARTGPARSPTTMAVCRRRTGRSHPASSLPSL